MRCRKDFSLTFIFLTSLLGLLLFLTLTNSLAANPLRIGLALGLTGKYAEMSEMQRKGFELWQKEVNSKGGLLGRYIQLIIYDDRSEPERAKELYERLIEKDKVDLIFAPYSSEITEVVAPIAERHGYPMIVSGASADRIWQKGYKYIFGLYTSASRYTEGFLELLVMKGLNDLAIVFAEDSFSIGLAEGTRKRAERLGLMVKFFEGFKKGEKNLDAIANMARASGARVLIVCGHLDESINMKLSLKRIGWRPIYFASVGPATERYQEILGPDSDLTFSSSQWEHSPSFTHCRDFYESFIRTYGIRPSYHAATAYAAGQLIEEASKRTRSIDRGKLRHILSVMEATTIIGRYKVDSTGMQIRHHNFIIQWQNGKKEIVWPESVRTAEPIFK